MNAFARNIFGHGVNSWILAIFGALLIGSTTGAVRADETENVTLKIERKTELFLAIWGLNVYVNGERVSTVYNGQTKTVTFPPAAEGKNNIQLGITDPRYPNDRSNLYSFQAYVAGVVNATLSTYADEGSACGSLELRVEKIGRVPAPEVVTVLNKEPIEVVVSTETIRTLPGTKRTVKRTRTVEHAVAITDSRGVEGAVGLDLGALSTQIRGHVERELQQSFKQSESVEQSIEIDGRELPVVKLSWVERRQTGKATMVLNGTNVELPFEFTLDVELRAELP